MADLKVGMVLEGVVTNVAAFGAFVDVGVHQDGLVHVSAMSDRFVSDPHEVVRSGQVVRVKVIEVDLDRQRIALTLRLNDTPQGGHRGERSDGKSQGKRPDRGAPAPRGDANQGKGNQGKGANQGNANRPNPNPNRDKKSGARESNQSTGSMAQALRDAGFGR